MKQLCMCSKSKHICNCSVNNSSSMRSRTNSSTFAIVLLIRAVCYYASMRCRCPTVAQLCSKVPSWHQYQTPVLILDNALWLLFIFICILFIKIYIHILQDIFQNTYIFIIYCAAKCPVGRPLLPPLTLVVGKSFGLETWLGNVISFSFGLLILKITISKFKCIFFLFIVSLYWLYHRSSSVTNNLKIPVHYVNSHLMIFFIYRVSQSY